MARTHTWHLTCADCGKGMHKSPKSLPQGEARCRHCRGHALPGEGHSHGTTDKYKAGCRCAPCRAVQSRRLSDWQKRYKAEHGIHYARRYDGRYAPKPYKYTEAMRRRDAARRARKAGAMVESFSHLEVFERDGWVCGICRETVDRESTYPDPYSPSLDHVVPLVHGGDHSKANARLAHLTCNVRRGAALDEVAA